MDPRLLERLGLREGEEVFALMRALRRKGVPVALLEAGSEAVLRYLDLLEEGEVVVRKEEVERALKEAVQRLPHLLLPLYGASLLVEGAGVEGVRLLKGMAARWAGRGGGEGPESPER